MTQIGIGIVAGIVSGTGMGGGTILIFLLTFMLGIEQHIAQATNLIFFIPTAIVAIIVNLKNKNIDILIYDNRKFGKHVFYYLCRNFKEMFWYIFSHYNNK